MSYPLSGCAASPWKGDDTLRAGRPFVGVTWLGQCENECCVRCLGQRAILVGPGASVERGS